MAEACETTAPRDDVEILDDQRGAAPAPRDLARRLCHWGDAPWMETAIAGEIADQLLAEEVAA